MQSNNTKNTSIINEATDNRDIDDLFESSNQIHERINNINLDDPFEDNNEI